MTLYFYVSWNYPFTIPGFHCIHSLTIIGENMRSGVAIMIKSRLWPSVHTVTRLKDQIWFSLTNLPDIRLGAVYITPQDSHYFTHEGFAAIQEQCSMHRKVLFLGDLNARLGDLIRFEDKDIAYSENPDKTRNSNGRDILNVCTSQHIIPVNHLKTQKLKCEGNLTFKKKKHWVSQLDWAMCSKEITSRVTNFQVLYRDLPTNHAPIVVSLDLSLVAQTPLAEAATLIGRSHIPNNNTNCRKATQIDRIDPVSFAANLPSAQQVLLSTPGEEAKQMANKLYAAAHASKRPLPKVDRKKRASQPPQDRRKRLMQVRDLPMDGNQLEWNIQYSSGWNSKTKWWGFCRTLLYTAEPLYTHNKPTNANKSWQRNWENWNSALMI